MGNISYIRRGLMLLLIFPILQIFLLQGIVGDSVTFFDVGQGDASYLRLPNTDIVIDGGPDSSFVHTLQKHLRVDNTIEYLVLTHFHADHYLGLVEVLNRYMILYIILPTSCITNDIVKEALVALEVPPEIIYTDFVRVSVKDGEVNLDFGDSVDTCSTSQKDVNNSSVVVEVDYNGKGILFMGDSEAERERDILQKKVISSKVDILKAGHHCSNSSTTTQFLNYVSPKVVVCSYGSDNTYGHPGYRVVKEIDRLGIRRLDTAIIGDITIEL